VDPDPPPAPEEVESLVPDPEKKPDSETASVAPETGSVNPEPPLVAPPVRSETTVVWEATVEITDVTVPIGSTCAPAVTALVDSPPSASMTRSRARIAAAFMPFNVYPSLKGANPVFEGGKPADRIRQSAGVGWR
jgi:hypothetical protein